MPNSQIHSITPWIECPDGDRLRVAMVGCARGEARVGALATPDEELFVVVELRAGQLNRPRELRLELYRGDERRDVWIEAVAADHPRPYTITRRITHGDRPGRSSRLHCRVLLDGREVAHPGVLLGAVAVDAQGRLSESADNTPMSDATVLAYGEAMQRLFGGENQ